MKKTLLPWQEECLQQWKKNQCKGIVHVVTGAGKTVLAIGAIEMLSTLTGDRPLKIKIVVPKTFLMYQWNHALHEELDTAYDDIGFYSGAHKTAASCRFTVYVINSARYSLSRHIAHDIKNGEVVFLIADECHHYGSEANANIFDFMGHIPRDASFYALGLSATPFCKNYNNVLVPALGREIYRFSFFSALKANIISQFILYNVRVNLDASETAEYEELSDKLGVALFNLTKRFPALYEKNGHVFFSALEHIIKNEDEESAGLAKAVLSLSIRRKEIVYLAKSRIHCVVDLVKLIGKTFKIIIFSERIETAEEIYQRLEPFFPNELGLYHSKMPTNMRKITLRQFENFEIRILVSCKTLDEGLNVSETDVGIIVSSTGSKRQRIQRLGRILRKKAHNRTAYFYYLFAHQTSEEDVLLEEMTDNHMRKLVPVISLRYDEQTGIFSNTYYDQLVAAAASPLMEKNYDIEKISEFLKNAELGLLTGDWLLDEKECQEKIKLASGKASKNYYITMLLLIQTRLAGGIFN